MIYTEPGLAEKVERSRRILQTAAAMSKLKYPDVYGIRECSNCGRIILVDGPAAYNYCPRCGARMTEEGKQ